MTTAFLAGAGVIAGIIATMVGGAAVVIYPALIATGVPATRGCLQSCFGYACDHAGGIV
ncbi:MAG: hypothetical protein WCD56_16295 [Pseudolabrys sp.]